MVALARVKRKHKERHGQDGSSPSFSSGGEQKPHRENDESNDSAEKPLQQPQLGENDETNQQQQQPQLQARRQESSSSSSSEEQERQFPIPPPRQPLGNDIRADVNNVPLPLVSESSDARQSNGFSSQSNATASGSGSNGNSGVSNKGSSGSGSGSNNGGSSGSGNEEKGDACGGNSNSDENNKVIEPAVAVGEPMLGLEQEANDDGSTREDRLMDKKRKRLDMRREYELDMNTSSSDDQESSFVPGKPVTLDTALSFSRMARYAARDLDCNVSIYDFLAISSNSRCLLSILDSIELSLKPRLPFSSFTQTLPLQGSLVLTRMKSTEDQYQTCLQYQVRRTMAEERKAIRQQLLPDEHELKRKQMWKD